MARTKKIAPKVVRQSDRELPAFSKRTNLTIMDRQLDRLDAEQHKLSQTEYKARKAEIEDDYYALQYGDEDTGCIASRPGVKIGGYKGQSRGIV